ncbi:efflux RND transporter periplasmic adaptor subunit [Lunatimonas salinarum]|uniref:efflux RND transporter periplasmic adaptor subunit n=1 Tax=Lunatimonas salinarum TaxID=1774590 RepID=UPI001ADFB475|nr:efflux RND transporter periplasmic adaptor subunit [Lunatimonas salinarum]
MVTRRIYTRWCLYLVCLQVGVSCSDPSGQKQKQGQVLREVPVIEVVAKDTVLHRQFVADVMAVEHVELRARVPGFLEKIYVDEGKEVKKGQLLFKTNDHEFMAELAKAKANLQSALAEAKVMEFEIERLKVMVDKNVISESELDMTKAKYEAVLAKIEEAKSAEQNAAVQVSYTEIRAPFDGIIDRLPQRTGSLIDPGTLLTTVSDVSAVNVYFNVSEREYLEYIKSNAEERLKHNMVKLILADGSNYPYDGLIETMEGEFNVNTGSIAFRARFPNPDYILKHRATGKIILSNSVRNAIIIPQKAVFEIQDRSFVYVVGEDNQVEMRSFVPKARFSHYYIVESGLQPGERLVYEGVQSLKDGMSIIPKALAIDHGERNLLDEGISMVNPYMP